MNIYMTDKYENLEKDVNWLFGNVIAMTKLTTSLYKIDLSLITILLIYIIFYNLLFD